MASWNKDGEPGQILAAMREVMRATGAIPKTREHKVGNQVQFRYRSIDDILNALQSALIANSVVTQVSLRDVARETVKTDKGKSMTVVCVELTVQYVALDGTFLASDGAGEGCDWGSDKATNKAVTNAMKNAHLWALQIPTGDPTADPDHSEHAPPRNTRRQLSDPGKNLRLAIKQATTYQEVMDLRSSHLYRQCNKDDLAILRTDFNQRRRALQRSVDRATPDPTDDIPKDFGKLGAT